MYTTAHDISDGNHESSSPNSDNIQNNVGLAVSSTRAFTKENENTEKVNQGKTKYYVSSQSPQMMSEKCALVCYENAY